MAASDEVRVVEGYTWDDGDDIVRFVHGEPVYVGDVPALLVIDSGLTAEQMRAALRSRDVLDAIREEVAKQRAATDTGGTDGQG